MKSLNQPHARIATLVFIIGMLSFAFNNCSGGSFQSVTSGGGNSVSAESFDLSKNTSAISYYLYSGSVNPVFQYSIQYDVDFQNKKIKVMASKGDQSAKALPNPGERAVSDDDILQLKLLLKGLKLEKICSSDMVPYVGGTSSSLSLYSTNLTNRDAVVSFAYCSGYSSGVPEYKVNAASEQAILDLLNRL